MKLEELKQPQRVEIDLRLPLFGGTAGLVLLCGWLVLGQSSGSGELLPLPEISRPAGAAGAVAVPAAGASQGEERRQERPDRQAKAGSGSAVQAVGDPFSLPAQGRPRAAGPLAPTGAAAAPREESLRLAGIISAGETRLALISRGSYDVCLALGEAQAGLTLLELGEDYVVLQTAAGERELRLTNAAGGGRTRETKNETRPDQRRSYNSTAAERQRRR